MACKKYPSQVSKHVDAKSRRRSRVFIISPDSVQHPLFVGLLQREARTTCIAEDNGEKNQSMERSRDDEREPHPEVIDLIVLR